MTKKQKYWIIGIVAALVIGVAVFALLNAGNLEDKKDSQQNAWVTIKRGETEIKIDLEYLKTFEKQVFKATVDTSKTDPVERSFSGVALGTVLEDKGLNLEGAKQVTFKAADGYTTVVTAEEAAQDENVYLVYERDGKPSGTKAQGGTGPIEIVIRKDQFSQRWCKFLMEITID